MPSTTLDALRARIDTEAVSDWVEVTQAMIDRFADATGDHQFIHVDPVAAAATPFGGTIAHGFLTLSLIPKLAGRVATAQAGAGQAGAGQIEINYGCNRLRFLTPVRSGSRIRARFRVTALTEKQPGQWLRTQDVTIEIEGQDKPALIAEWLGLIVL